MSKVYSFRLSDNNPREAQAREVIEAWVAKGFSLRQIIVKSLIALSQDNKNIADTSVLIEYLEKRFIELLHDKQNGNLEKPNLPSTFLQAIRNSAKSGIQQE